MKNKRKWNVLKRGLTSGAAYDASVQDYYENLQRQYEEARRKQAEYENRKREYERELRDSEEKKAKLQRERDEYLKKLKKDTLPEEREKAAARAQEKWGNGETPDQRDQDLFEISDYKKQLQNGNSEQEWYEKAWRKIKDFFLSADGITATGWKMNDIQASQFSGNLVKSREDQQLINMAEDYFKGNKTQQNREAVQELNRRKPNFLNKAAVYANKVLDWIGNNSITGTTGAFLGTDELDKVRTNINFDENTTSQEALQNIAALRNSYKAFDEESYNAYLENHNKAKYYENMLSNDAKRKIDIAEGRLPDENGVTDGSVEFFNFSKLKYQLPGIIAGSISSPSQLLSSFATGIATAAGVAATATAAGAAVVGTGGFATPAVLGGLTALGAGATFGLNQASGSHENAAEVDEGYVSKVKYALDRHPGIAADFYKSARSVLGEHATQEDIITAKLANRIPATNTIVEKAFDDAAIGSQRQYDRDMVATTGDSTIDTALQITPIKFFSTLGKSAIKANLRSSRIARAAAKIGRGLDKLGGGTDGVLRNAFAKYGAIVSAPTAALGAAAGTVLDNVVGRIPKVNTLIKSFAHFDLAKIKRIGPKASNWITYSEGILGKGLKSSISEGIEEGKQYYNQQRAVKEFQDGLRNGNLSYETQSFIGDVLDDFQAGGFASAGLIHAVTGIPLLDYLHYTDENIINAAEAIKNIKSGMIGGWAQTSAMTAITGFNQTRGTSNAIDDFELAIRALEQNKLAAQKQFAVDQILSKTNRKYVDNAIDYLKNSSSIKLNDQELEDLLHRAIEVEGVSKSPYVKSLAKEMGIADEDYHKFVADYMYHKDNLETERENLQGATRDLNAEIDKTVARSRSIENFSNDVLEQWRKNDTDNNRRIFENDKTSQINKLEKHLQSLNDKLEKEALTKSEKAKVQEQITETEKSLNETKDAKFNESEVIEYSDARFGRINALARIRGTIKQLNSLEAILSSMGDENVEGRKFIQSQIDVAKKMLNDQLAGNMLDDKQLTADNLAEVNRWANIIARNIERADKDNPAVVAASDELAEEIESLSQAYQEHAKAALDYNIARDLFYDFVGYNIKDGQIVEEGTEGAERVKGNAKEHLEGIMSAQDDDAKLEQAYQQGFANYGFSGVYKNESPLVQAEEEEEERSHPGTRERRNRIKHLGRNIRDFARRARNYVSGTWKSFGFKRVFVPDDANERASLDPSENQLDAQEYYAKIIADYKAADDIDKWLDSPSIDTDETGNIKTNGHLLISAYLNTLDISNDISVVYDDATWSRVGEIFYRGISIGHVCCRPVSKKSDGDAENNVIVYTGQTIDSVSLDLNQFNNDDYLKNIVDSLHPTGIIRTVQENGKIRLSLPSHTESKPRQVVLDPQGDNKYYIHARIWDDADKKIPGNISDEEKKQLFDAVYDELPDGAEILLPKSGPGYYATRGTIALLQRLKRDTRFTPGTEGIVEYQDKDGKTVKKYKGTSFIKAQREFTSSVDITEEQTAMITVLSDLSQKMNEKFDTVLTTSSHYFERVGTGENRRLKLWHRLHDEIGSNFGTNPIDKKNWSNCIKKLYSIVYHTGYIEEDGTSDGIKDIPALLDYLQNTYKNNNTIGEPTLQRIKGYIEYLEQEGNDISDSDLYECIKGMSEEIIPEVRGKNGHLSLDRGTAVDKLCRVVLGTDFSNPQEAIEFCKILKMTNKSGYEMLVSELFTEQGFEEAVTHLWNTRKVYTETLGYALWTAPFTIYTEELVNRDGARINIAGEVDMLAIDKNGRVIIVDYKTSKKSFFNKKRDGYSIYFKEQGDNFTRSPLEQYTNQQNAYIQMLNETARKETSVADGFQCNEARLLPIVLTSALDANLVNKVDIEFNKDLQLVLKTIPFKQLADKPDLIMDKEEYRTKLSKLSKLYAKVNHIANHLEIYYAHVKDRNYLEQIKGIQKDLDSILLSLQEITLDDLDQYEEDIRNHITMMMSTYFNNKEVIDELFAKYKAAELRIESEENIARSFNNIDWKNSIYDEDIEQLGGFSAMGVKDRKEYDEKVDELAHVACNRDFQSNSSAKLTAVQYKTRQGNDKISVYATITYKGTTYPPIRLYLSKTNGQKFAQDVLDGNVFGGNIKTTVGLLSECSDGNQHLIGESKQLIDAIGGTEEDPYRNFAVNIDISQNVALVAFNKTTGTLTTISRTGSGETISLPKTLKNSSANGHIIINVIPDNSSTGNPIPIVCNTSEITEVLGKDKSRYRNGSLLDFIVEDVLQQVNRAEGGDALNKRYVTENGEEIPLTLGQILNFFFEPFNPDNGSLVERPQYEITTGGGQSRYIRIGNFSDSPRTISLDNITDLKNAIMGLNIWISANMAGVKWDSSDENSIAFNEFAEWLRNRTEKFYLGKSGIYFDKSDADGTYLGFLAKNGLLHTPFNGFSHPLISINTCQKEAPITPALGEGDGNGEINPPSSGRQRRKREEPKRGGTDADIGWEASLDDFMAENAENNTQGDDDIVTHINLKKLQHGRYQLDESAARQYIEQVLGKSFADSKLEFVDEISSAIVGGLSAGTIIAGQVTANMMKLSHYAQSGTEYHEAFHWAFELIIDPRDSRHIRNIVRRKYGITDERKIAEWLADTYMTYISTIYKPNANILQKAFNKIKQWGITFWHMFTGEYQIYKLYNAIHRGDFANKPISNKAVLRFQKKFIELNSKLEVHGFKKDGLEYRYVQGPIDHRNNIAQLAFFVLNTGSSSPALNYVKNTRLTTNLKSILEKNYFKEAMMQDYYKGGKSYKGFKTEQLEAARKLSKYRPIWDNIDTALALRELLDDDHIEKTNEYVNAYIDQLIGVKGKDLSIDAEDGSDDEGQFDRSYIAAEDGEPSDAGGNREHLIPDHQISRMAKTSSRIKLFFATIPIVRWSDADKRYNYARNRFGKFGYYELKDIYQTIQNSYHDTLSPQALWEALEYNSANNDMIASLCLRLNGLRKLASKGNNNAIGLLNEIYNSIVSSKLQQEVIKTKYDKSNGKLSYRNVDVMVQNNSFALCREFSSTVFGNFNKFYQQIPFIDESGNKTWGISVRSKIEDDATGELKSADYRLNVFEEVFGTAYRSVNIVQKNAEGDEVIVPNRSIYSIATVLMLYGTRDERSLYIKDPSRSKKYKKDVYAEVSIEDYLPYVKSRFVEGLSTVGIDITVNQLNDILETQFGGIGVRELRQLLIQPFEYQDKRDPNKTGGDVTLFKAVQDLYSLIDAELLKGRIPQNRANGSHQGEHVIRQRKEEYLGKVKNTNGLNVFRNQRAHVLIATLVASAQQKKYEVSARSVDGKLSYAMSDHNTVTAMCDVVFDRTNDVQCAKIRQMILDDPFNVSTGTPQFGNIQIGSFILPLVQGNVNRGQKLRDVLSKLKDDINDDSLSDEQFDSLQEQIDSIEHQLRQYQKQVDYEVVSDGGIETGNNENSSTDSEKRGADTIISIITKLCQNMIVIAPFADKSTALSVRLKGIRIPGIDYSKITYQFKHTENQEKDSDAIRQTNIKRQFIDYITSIDVDDTGKVTLNKNDNKLDETVAGYVLAEYQQAKKAIQDYKDLLRNHALPGSKTEVEEKYKTALSICKRLMFMSQFSGDYVQVKNDATGQWEWVFKPFGVENGVNKSDVEAAEEMIKQFESIVFDKAVFDKAALLSFVNRHINGLMQHELEKLQEFGIIKRIKPTKIFPNPDIQNVLLDNNIISNIFGGVFIKNRGKHKSITNISDQAIRIFMYDIVGKSIISKQESERLFTGQSDLYKIVRDKETRIITVPYQDQAKRIGSFASTGSVGVIDDEDYICAEIPDDEQSIEDQVIRSVYINEIAGYIKTGDLNMDEHPDFDFRFATLDEIKELIPKEFQPIVDRKVTNIMRGFVTHKKDGSEIKNNVTDGSAFISAKFAEKLVRSQGAWDEEIAKAFRILTSNEKQDVQQILTSYDIFSKVWTQVIGTYKYTAVGFRTENVNGQNKVVQYVNKYSLAPVFACMCNEKMNAIREQMDKQNVDVLMFESAVKVGAHGNSSFVVDSAGNVTGEFNTYSQKRFFLRKQLNTNPNEKEIMKIGIQTVKVALSAVIGEKGVEFRGQMMDGDQIIQEIMNDIDRLTEARRKKLMGKLGSEKQVIDYVANFLRGNNVPEDVIKAFQDGIPAEALSIQKHVDTLSAKRIQQDIVRINAPGSAFIQRTVYGVEGPSIKFGNLELNDGEELKVVNSDGSMDCVLSLDYFVEYKNGIPYFKLTPKGKKRVALQVYDKELGKMRPMSFEEIRQWLKDNNVIGKNAKSSILSYRIPTQAVASINALKCVDVIPVVRDTVILPKLFTTITGSDFDIDKLFMSTVWYEMEEQPDGTYKPRQLEVDRSDDQLENATEEELSNNVINDYIDILCMTAKNHPEIFYRSIDQDTKLADDVIAFIDSIFPPTQDDKLANASGMLHSMPSMQAKVHDEFQAGKQGIGPFALALVNHVLTRIYDVSFKARGIYLSHKSLATDEDDDGNSIMSWLSAMINKHVDVAKNPDITKLNVNNSTFNVVALLLRLGYGRRTFMFTCQPIMRDYAFAIDQQTAVCKYTKNENGYTDARRDAFNEMLDKYNLKQVKNELLKGISVSDIQAAACMEIFEKNVDGKSLLQLVLENKGKVPVKKRTYVLAGTTREIEEPMLSIRIGDKQFPLTQELFQYLNLQLFNYLSDFMAAPLSQLQQASVIDNERCITSMIQSEFYKQQVDKVKTSKVFDNVDKLFKLSYIDKKIDASLDGTSTIYNAASCMDKAVVVSVAKFIDPNVSQYGRKRMQSFLGTVRDGMVAYYAAKFFDQYCKDNNINRSGLFVQDDNNDNSIVRRLAGIQASTKGSRGKYRSLRNNLLIKGLSIEGIVGEEYVEREDSSLYDSHRFMNYQFLRFSYAGQSEDNILADVQYAWQELFDYPDETIKKFARDLVVYAFYTSGEMSGNTKLFKYVPPEWRLSSGYGQYFKNLKEDKEHQFQNLGDIIDKLCRNLWYKDQFVKKIGLGKISKMYAPDAFTKHKRVISTEENTEEVNDPIGSPIICGIEYSQEGENLVVRPAFDRDTSLCPRYIKCVNIHHDSLTINDDDSTSWLIYKLVGFKTYTDNNEDSWDYPVYVQTSALGEKYFRNNVFEYNDELEENQNMDAYAIVENFISKVGKLNKVHGANDKITKSDITDIVEKITTLLEQIDKQVDYDLTNATGDISDLAGQVVDIVMNRQTGESTFIPYTAVNDFLEQKQKQLEAQIDNICG